MEVAAVVVVELGEGRVGDVDLHDVGANDEPDEEGGDADDDDDGEDELEDKAEEAAAAPAAPAAASGAVVGFRRWDGGAVVGSVQLGLFLRHGRLR